MIETKVPTMFLSSGVNIHGDSTLHVFGKRSVSSKATYSNVSKEKFSLCPTAKSKAEYCTRVHGFTPLVKTFQSLPCTTALTEQDGRKSVH